MQRSPELFLAVFIFIILFPLFLITGIFIFLTDFKNPFYVADRVGIDGIKFKMFKFRSMRKVNSMVHIVSTSETDIRITWIGRIIRKYKIQKNSINLIS